MSHDPANTSLALALLGAPAAALGPAAVARILDGGRSVCSAAGIPIAGGHSIESAEPFYHHLATAFKG